MPGRLGYDEIEKKEGWVIQMLEFLFYLPRGETRGSKGPDLLQGTVVGHGLIRSVAMGADRLRTSPSPSAL